MKPSYIIVVTRDDISVNTLSRNGSEQNIRRFSWDDLGVENGIRMVKHCSRLMKKAIVLIEYDRFLDHLLKAEGVKYEPFRK